MSMYDDDNYAFDEALKREVGYMSEIERLKAMGLLQSELKNVIAERDESILRIAELERLLKAYKVTPTCIQTESGYACSHCGTTLRADSPDYQLQANLEARCKAAEAERDALRAVIAAAEEEK